VTQAEVGVFWQDYCKETRLIRSRIIEKQVVNILKEADAGVNVKDVCRRHGIGDSTYYNWKSKYGGKSPSELKRLRETEAELSQYKTMYAELTHENYAVGRISSRKSSEAAVEAPTGVIRGFLKNRFLQCLSGDKLRQTDVLEESLAPRP
jgi:putative transposase